MGRLHAPTPASRPRCSRAVGSGPAALPFPGAAHRPAGPTSALGPAKAGAGNAHTHAYPHPRVQAWTLPPSRPPSSAGVQASSTWQLTDCLPAQEAHCYLLSSDTPPAQGAAFSGTLLPSQPCLPPPAFSSVKSPTGQSLQGHLSPGLFRVTHSADLCSLLPGLGRQQILMQPFSLGRETVCLFSSCSLAFLEPHTRAHVQGE